MNYLTPGEIVLMIGLLAHAIAIWLGLRYSNNKLNGAITDIHKIELATNSMKDELVAVTRKGALAEGVKTEKDRRAHEDVAKINEQKIDQKIERAARKIVPPVAEETVPPVAEKVVPPIVERVLKKVLRDKKRGE